MLPIHRTERGQAIVLIVLSIAALFAFAALAVDGGQVYSERRRAQNAADAAAYAAAMAAIHQEDPLDAAYDQAEFNDYDAVQVVVNHPPLSGSYVGDPEYYQVIITANIEPTFASIILSQPMVVQAEAVSHATNSTPLTAGNAIHGLNEDENDTIRFDGGVIVNVLGGNIFSNGGMRKDGGSGKITIVGGGTFYSNGDCHGCTNAGFSPLPKPSEGAIEIAPLPEPECPGNAPAPDLDNNVYYPGTYNSIINFQGGQNKMPWTFEPGMYCLKNGMTANGNIDIYGTGVFFVLKGGEIKLNGNGVVNLSRAEDIEDANGNQWGGMLIYTPESYVSKNGGQGSVWLSGNNNSKFAGTILSPHADCSFGGTSGTVGLKSNIICDMIDFHGGATVKVDFRQAENFTLPAILELSE